MKCTVCKIETSGCIKDHYKSEFHQLNSQRKIHNIPPILLDEYLRSVEDKIKEEKNTFQTEHNTIGEEKIKVEVSSMIEQQDNMCEEMEEASELQSHENSIYEEESYSSENNENCPATDGINLYLPNGKVLGNREYMKYYKQNYSIVDLKERKRREPIKLLGQLSRYIFYNRKESLKKALQINMQKKLRPFILR